MDVKSANPFLFAEDDYTSPSAAPLNPFLMAEDDFADNGGGNDNPFLSQTAASVAPTGGTNPFAFDAMDLGPAEAAPAFDINTTFQNTFMTNTYTDNAVNFFAEPANTQNYYHPEPSGHHPFLIDTEMPTAAPQKPTDLDLRYSNTVAMDEERNGGPGRPPPPRPPPSKETQDLLMTVMGAMDATSSHLLDRIPPTRTPSPVSMRDLHSPSPTPEPQFVNLLDVSETKPALVNTSQSVNFMDDDLMGQTACDINKNHQEQQQAMDDMPNFEPEPIMNAQPPMFDVEPMIAEQPAALVTNVPSPVQQPFVAPAPASTQPPVYVQPLAPAQPPPPVLQTPPVQPPPHVQPPPPVQPPPYVQPPPPVQPPAYVQPLDPVPPPVPIQPPPPVIPPSYVQPLAPVQPPAPIQHPAPPHVPIPHPVQEPGPISVAAPVPAPIPSPVPAPVPAPVRSAPPARPGPPVRPPRPAPPMKPPSPAIPPAPPKPPPPVAVVKPVQEPIPPEPVDEMMEIFGSQQQPAKSKADILNLYKKAETPLDLLCDGMDAAPSSVEALDGSASGSGSRKSSVPSRKSSIPSRKSSVPSTDNSIPVMVQSIVDVNIIEPPEDATKSPSPAPENYISPEPSQADLQMDTSDSQSKGSASSVTMNPFAGNDEISSPAVQSIRSSPSDIQPIGETPVKLDNNVFHEDDSYVPSTMNIFAAEPIQNETNIFAVTPPDTISDLPPKPLRPAFDQQRFGLSSNKSDSFDAFSLKFESAKDENKNGAFPSTDDTWGNSAFGASGVAFNDAGGFGAEESFDAFLALQEPPSVPQSTPCRMNKAGSLDSDEDKDFSVVIKPKMGNETFSVGALPILAPPPVSTHNAFADISPRMNPFDNSGFAEPAVQFQEPVVPIPGSDVPRSEGDDSPGTPLFDDDISQPLEQFPRLDFKEEGWELHLRQPNKKKITGQRFWKKIFIRLSFQPDCILLQLFNQQADKDPFQELPLQPCYSVSEIGAQQYDNYGKIFTVKLQYIFYKERPGVRPGQVKKAERITNKLSQFAAYAIQGDYQGVKEFGSDLKKLGLPVEHAPQVSQLMKIGSLNFEDLKQFSVSIEEALFKLQAHRDRALHYKMEEVQVTCVDELYVHQSYEGHIEKQVARVRLFFLGFLTGMPDIELGVNDMRRQGKEVVGRHDIIPVVTEEWIRLEAVEFHNSVQQDEYHDTHIIKFKPPDACYIELMRFRVRPPKNRELPLQLKATLCITGTKVEIRADILVPGFASRKLGQVPCEDVMVRVPIPECWIYLFRVEKHFRYGSVKSAHRRTGKIKGIERILGTVDTLQESLIEVTSGQAKYEHQHRAIVWRCPRLPKEGQGAYTTHNMVCRMALTSFDQIPDQLAEHCFVEFTMPATQASHTTVRSVSIQNSDSDEPPEKFVRHLARHEYRVGIEHIEAEGPNAYISAAMTKPKPAPIEEKPKPIPEAESSSDSE